MLLIEVVYAGPSRAVCKYFRVSGPATVHDALSLAAVDPDFVGIDLATSALGVFGRVVGADHPLSDGDRIEIYRPLAADPKNARRARVKDSRKNR